MKTARFINCTLPLGPFLCHFQETLGLFTKPFWQSLCYRPTGSWAFIRKYSFTNNQLIGQDLIYVAQNYVAGFRNHWLWSESLPYTWQYICLQITFFCCVCGSHHVDDRCSRIRLDQLQFLKNYIRITVLDSVGSSLCRLVIHCCVYWSLPVLSRWTQIGHGSTSAPVGLDPDLCLWLLVFLILIVHTLIYMPFKICLIYV